MKDLIECKCPICGESSFKSIYDYQRGRGCLICSGNKRKTTEDFKTELDEDYKLLDEYVNAYTKIHLKHSCGFIYTTTPHNYLGGSRCPLCMRKHSKGENKIKKFLDKNEIPYIQEYMKKIDGHNLRFDFYLPCQELYIEYQGVQHFQPVEFFGGVARFIKQQEYDKLKQQYNTFNINYQDYDKIEDILSNLLLSSTTISEESTS